MKKRIYLLAPVMIMAGVLLTAFGGDENGDYPSGSPAGYTGSPGDGQHCVACHGGSASTVSGWITSNIPPEGYTAGNTYTITVTVSGSGGKGFEVSPQSPSGTQLGILAPGSGSKIVGGTKYVTQTSKSTANPASWSFSWTAPAAGTGEVTFYGAFTVSEPVTKLSTLTVQENVATLLATATATPGQICAGDSSHLQVVVTGGTGSYTYLWSAAGGGFTSTLAAPWVKPLQNESYSVTVTDGGNTTSTSVDIIVNQLPTSYAGIDTVVCIQETLFWVSGWATNFSTIFWSTSGDGTFQYPSGSLSTFYYPGPLDKATGWTNLYLTANPLSPCVSPANSARHIVYDPCTGISEENHFQKSLKISAGKRNDPIIVSFCGKAGNPGTMIIFNAEGKKVLAQDITFTGSSQTEQITISGGHAGIYLLILREGEQIATGRFIIY